MSEGQSGTHTAPGEGVSVWLVGDLITLKLTSEDSGGACSMFEETSPPGGGPPPHTLQDAAARSGHPPRREPGCQRGLRGGCVT